MAQSTAFEPFPPAIPLTDLITSTNNDTANASNQPKRRRRSSGLPADPQGDTSVPALATIDGAPGMFSATPPVPKSTRGHKRRKAKSLFKRWARFSLRHTWVNPLILCLLGLFLYALNPTTSNPMHSALFISYPMARSRIPGSTAREYGKGGRDFVFIAYYTIVFSFTREFVMQRILRPLALRYGLKSRAKQNRYMEQAYSALYTAIMSPLGLYVMYRSPVWYFNTTAMYEGFPHRQHEGLFKTYYLLQASFWTQQALVLLLQLEAPRKDFKEFVLHHVVTISLIWCSYRFHFAFMGIGVFFTHDVSDFFLATSKLLNYIDHPLTGPYFTFFIFVWAYTRHYLNLRLLYSVMTTFATVGPFELNWETQQYKCWISQYITFALLASLQAVNLFWFVAILRIAKRYVVASELEDDRSEYDPEEEEAEGATEEKRRLLKEKGVDVPGAEFKMGTPQVLLNGMPVDQDAVNGGMNGHAIGNGTGAQKVEVKRTLRSRKV